MDAAEECNRRAKDVFSVLDGFEKGYQDYLATPELVKSAKDLVGFDPFEEHNSRKRKHPDSEESTLESVVTPARETKKCFIRDPSKWTEYTLEDVTEEQMSDGACRRAAFEFLRSRGVIQDIVEDEGEFDAKCVFGAAVKKKQEMKKPKEVRSFDSKSFASRLGDELDDNVDKDLEQC